MKPNPPTGVAPQPAPPDLELEAGCPACGGSLSLRVRPGTVRGVCRACGAWTAPRLWPDDHGFRLHHRLAAAA